VTFLSVLTKLKTGQDALTYATLFPAIEHVEKLLKPCDSLIDIGCGEASWLRFLSFRGTRLGVDGWEPAIRASQRAKIHDSYILSDIRSLALPAASADAVLCLDVIEHLPKNESREVVSMIDVLARRLVIIVTPNGFVEQIPVDGNEYQRHLCGWSVEELRAAGFTVYGMYGLKSARGPFGKIARSPRPLWWLISKLSEWYVWNRPERAFGLLAVKQK
jgi:hypothetical protein